MSHRTAPEGYRVLVCAPYGQDAATIFNLLQTQGYQANICPSLHEVAAAMDDALGVVLLTEEAIAGALSKLAPALKAQPRWSDIPFVVLAARQSSGRRPAEALRLRLLELTHNAVVLERPLGSASIFSAVDSAMRARQHQFEMRDRLAELDNAAAELERQVQARTVELEEALARLHAETEERERAEASLRQSQKMEAVGQLTGGIAHDFNNMLTGITGSLDLMRRRIATGRTENLDRYMDAASASAERAAALTQRLLAFSRRQSLDPQPNDINHLIGAMSDLVERAIDERIELKLAYSPGLPAGVVDPHQFENAVLNLAINARDAMPNGGHLTIETSVAELDEAYVRDKAGLEPGRYVVVSVSDTGVGMPADVIAQVFDPFFTTKPLGQGTGLGLSMVYGFAQQSGGQVRIHSQVGVGTSVKLYLPTTDASPIRAARRGPHASRGHGERVLVAEDDPSVRLLVREVLEELGYQSVEFADPLSALPYLSSDARIDLMISDVGMPGMNGRELAERARMNRPDLPILFITGYAENAAIRAGFLGANMAMVTKPFSLDELAAKVSEMLAQEANGDAE